MKKIIIIVLTLGVVGTGVYIKSMLTTPQQPSTSQQPTFQPKSLLYIATKKQVAKLENLIEKKKKPRNKTIIKKLTTKTIKKIKKK